MSGWLWCAVAGFGALGAVARFLLAEWIDRRAHRPFPLGILVVNLSGAFGLGLNAGLKLSPTLETLLGTALIGAYTTFSTWVVETDAMLEHRRGRAGLINVAVSLLAGFVLAAAGKALG